MLLQNWKKILSQRLEWIVFSLVYWLWKYGKFCGVCCISVVSMLYCSQLGELWWFKIVVFDKQLCSCWCKWQLFETRYMSVRCQERQNFGLIKQVLLNVFLWKKNEIQQTGKKLNLLMNFYGNFDGNKHRNYIQISYCADFNIVIYLIVGSLLICPNLIFDYSKIANQIVKCTYFLS